MVVTVTLVVALLNLHGDLARDVYSLYPYVRTTTLVFLGCIPTEILQASMLIIFQFNNVQKV